jgi:DNA-binding transcriptional LysR family regulator
LRHLVALQAVGQDRSFRRAAERLGYVQSAVSQQIAFLERRLGARLVHRNRGPKLVSLTEAGTVVLGHVEEILAQLRVAQADVAALSEGRVGALRVGAYDEITIRLLPPILRDFARRRPEVEITTVESSNDARLLELCEAGELDVTFADLPLAAGPFAWRELLADPYSLVVSGSSRLARRRKVDRLDDLASLRLIRQRGSRQAARVDAQLHARGLCPPYIREADSTAAIQAFVGASIGAAFLPRLAIDVNDPSVAVIDMSRVIAPRLIGLVWHRDRGKRAALDAFIASAVEVSATLEARGGDRAAPAARA